MDICRGVGERDHLSRAPGSYLVKKRSNQTPHHMSVGNCTIGLKRLPYFEVSVDRYRIDGMDHEIPYHTCRGVYGIVVTVRIPK